VRYAQKYAAKPGEVQAVLSFYGNYRPNAPQERVGRTRLDPLYATRAWSAGTLRGPAPYELAYAGISPVLVVKRNSGSSQSRAVERVLRAP
jgi:hypothetical protein